MYVFACWIQRKRDIHRTQRDDLCVLGVVTEKLIVQKRYADVCKRKSFVSVIVCVKLCKCVRICLFREKERHTQNAETRRPVCVACGPHVTHTGRLSVCYICLFFSLNKHIRTHLHTLTYTFTLTNDLYVPAPVSSFQLLHLCESVCTFM